MAALESEEGQNIGEEGLFLFFFFYIFSFFLDFDFYASLLY